jgi:hypothetical protein
MRWKNDENMQTDSLKRKYKAGWDADETGDLNQLDLIYEHHQVYTTEKWIYENTL